MDECKAGGRRGSSWRTVRRGGRRGQEDPLGRVRRGARRCFRSVRSFGRVVCCLKRCLQRLMAIFQDQMYPSSKQFHRHLRPRHLYFIHSPMISSAKAKELRNTGWHLAGYKLGQSPSRCEVSPWMPSLSLSPLLSTRAIWQEYEDGQTLEAHFGHDTNKILRRRGKRIQLDECKAGARHTSVSYRSILVYQMTYAVPERIGVLGDCVCRETWMAESWCEEVFKKRKEF